MDTNHVESLVLPDAPALPGLTFRGFRGAADFPAMIAVIHGCKAADHDERAETVEDITRNYEDLTNCDPHRDMLMVEMDGALIGYARVLWQARDLEQQYTYQHFNFLLPEWRGRGIRRAMLRYCERRLREIAAEHTFGGARWLEAWASNAETHWTGLLLEAGYQPVRYGYAMVRPNLEDIPDLTLPVGLEVRPVQPADYDRIWAAAREAFRDHWGYSADDWALEHFAQWQKAPTFTPHLWQVAWAGDEVAGMILNFIDAAENVAYQRQRGYTETICVRRPWRRLGLARALLAASFGVLRDAGMTEAALGVDAENPNGARQLYESMGFQTVKEFVTYRKPLAL